MLALTTCFTQHSSRTSMSFIIPKNKSAAISQWIDWNYMEGKHDRIFDKVVAACKAKHLRDSMTFKKNWDNEIIA
jgi:precorrin isomerase